TRYRRSHMTVVSAKCRDGAVRTAVRVRFLLSLCVAALVWMPARPRYGQVVSTSSGEGTVTDETSAALPGVTITPTSPALQVAQLVETTNSEGFYRFTQLPAGVFRVRFELSGFQSVIREELQVGVGFAAKLDIRMKIGAVEETITVSGASPII